MHATGNCAVQSANPYIRNGRSAAPAQLARVPIPSTHQPATLAELRFPITLGGPLLHLLVSVRSKQRRGVGPGKCRSPRHSPYFEPSSLESTTSNDVASKARQPAGPYVRVFRLRGPVAERGHVYGRASGDSSPAPPGSPGCPCSRRGRRALGGIALRLPSFLS
jgi:hypothetical protein